MAAEEEPTDRPRPEALSAAERQKRRRRLAEIFGEVLPEQTSDDQEPAPDSSAEAAQDAWYRRQVPPHHG